MIEIAERIKDALTMEDVLHKYGFETSSNDRIPCPLHNGHDRNFSYKEKHFKCFVCDKSGSVIDFVMELFKITFRQAILRINEDFALGFTHDRPDPAERAAFLERRRRAAERKMELERLERMHLELAKEHVYWREVLDFFTPTRQECESGCIHPLYVEATKKQPYLEYMLEEIEDQIQEVKKSCGRK